MRNCEIFASKRKEGRKREGGKEEKRLRGKDRENKFFANKTKTYAV